MAWSCGTFTARHPEPTEGPSGKSGVLNLKGAGSVMDGRRQREPVMLRQEMKL